MIMLSNTVCTLLGLVAWAVALSFLLVTVRLMKVSGGKPLNEFDPTGKDLDGFAYRVTRAHGNTAENLAILVAPMLYAIATNQTAITAGLAGWVLYSRIGQSVAHMISTSKPMVLVRATFFSVQLVIIVIWLWKFWHA
jgi:uncharacterized MAPEG superfamily protein